MVIFWLVLFFISSACFGMMLLLKIQQIKTNKDQKELTERISDLSKIDSAIMLEAHSGVPCEFGCPLGGMTRDRTDWETAIKYSDKSLEQKEAEIWKRKAEDQGMRNVEQEYKAYKTLQVRRKHSPYAQITSLQDETTKDLQAQRKLNVAKGLLNPKVDLGLDEFIARLTEALDRQDWETATELIKGIETNPYTYYIDTNGKRVYL